jgi:hypothetical protein
MTAADNRYLKTVLQFVIRPVPASILTALLTFLTCYFRSFVSIGVPVVLWGDQIGFFNDGSRMALGQLPYRDYFKIVPPGTDLTYALLIKTFGVQMWIPNLLMAFLAASAALLMTLITSRLMRGAIVVVPGLLLASFILLASTDATHHWFSTIAILAALLVVIDGITLPRIAFAGALSGVAACFTQSKGAMAVAAFVVYLAAYANSRSETLPNGRWKKSLLLGGVAVGVFATVNLYFIQAAGLRTWLYCLIVYPLRYYPSPTMNNWRVLIDGVPSHAGLITWVIFFFVYATVPLVYFAFLAGTRKLRSRDGRECWDKLLLVAITGLSMFLAVASSPSLKRLATVSPPAMILLVWLLNQPGKAVSGLRILLACTAAALAIAMPVYVQTRSPFYLNLPAGRAALFDPVLHEEYRWLLGNTHPGEYFFGLTPFYTAFHMLNAAPIVDFHASDYTRPWQIAALIEALENHQVSMLVLRRTHDFLWAAGSPSDHLEPLRIYVSRNYRLTKTFLTGDEVWLRIRAPAASCRHRCHSLTTPTPHT